MLLLASLMLCACEGEPLESSVQVSADESVFVQESSEETDISCTHEFGNEPIEIVGNLYVFECTLCGMREIVPQGTAIGGEE